MLRAYFERAFFGFQEAVVPRARLFSAEQRAESLRLVDGILASKPGSVRLQITVFLLLIDAWAILTRGRSLRGLAPDAREEVLRVFFDSGVPPLRKGFWGVSTLAKLGAYGQPSLYPSLHYELRGLSTDE